MCNYDLIPFTWHIYQAGLFVDYQDSYIWKLNCVDDIIRVIGFILTNPILGDQTK